MSPPASPHTPFLPSALPLLGLLIACGSEPSSTGPEGGAGSAAGGRAGSAAKAGAGGSGQGGSGQGGAGQGGSGQSGSPQAGSGGTGQAGGSGSAQAGSGQAGSAQAGSGGMGSCPCVGGLYEDGTPIDPATTHCGQIVCGTTKTTYECTASGWAHQGVPCGQSGAGGAAGAGGSAEAAQGGSASAGKGGSAGSVSGAACDAGGQIIDSKGAEDPFGEAVIGLCRRALGCPAVWQLAPPPEGYKYKGTPNHKLLWRVWNYGWAQEAAPQQVADARSFLIEFFDAQLAAGHQALGDSTSGGSGNEILTGSHYQIWANGMTCARLLAVRHSDGPLLEATGRWWRGERALYDLLQRDGIVDAPGARTFGVGHLELRDTIYAMLKGAPLGGGAAKPKGPWWDNVYNVAAWTLREVLKLGDDMGGAKGTAPLEPPKLRDPLYLYTQGDDFVFVFPKMRGALDPMFWVARINGQKSYAPATAGKPIDNPNPPPDLPGATLTILPGVP